MTIFQQRFFQVILHIFMNKSNESILKNSIYYDVVEK